MHAGFSPAGMPGCKLYDAANKVRFMEGPISCRVSSNAFIRVPMPFYTGFGAGDGNLIAKSIRMDFANSWKSPGIAFQEFKCTNFEIGVEFYMVGWWMPFVFASSSVKSFTKALAIIPS